ncbi:hypothetical protein OROHE_023740 [Orobanche hederae]
MLKVVHVETIDVISEVVRSSNIPRSSIICTENVMKSPLSQQMQSPISSLVHVAAPTSISSRKMRKSTVQQQRYKSLRQQKSILAAASQQFYKDIVDQIFVKQSINTNIINNRVYLDNGDADFTCEFCEAIMWYDERIYKSKQLEKSVFSMCCAQGKVQLPLLKTPPLILKRLLLCEDPRSLLPTSGNSPKFSQLYIYDTEHEVENRINVMSNRSKPSRNSLDVSIINDLKNMLDDNNSLRDVIIETRTGLLKRISELHPSYLSLQYPLLFPYGEDGYRVGIQHSDASSVRCTKRNKLTIRELFAFRIQERKHEAKTLLFSRRLFQQILVDGYTIVESERITYIKNNQSTLRLEKYTKLNAAVSRGETTPSSTGQRIFMPTSFTGGARYMMQNYQDAMAICKWFGYPDLFITITCNPKWPEIARFPGTVIYTVEFQKRGLPHAHILLFLKCDRKTPTADDVDQIISAEIPDQVAHPRLYELVSTHMMNGPCSSSGNEKACMKKGKCTKRFPKRYFDRTTIDDDGYPIYKRRDNRYIVNKSGMILDNRFVVPHNPLLLLRYQAHINVEWCDQFRSIKYLFKYINKGNDRVTATISQENNDTIGEQHVDETQNYYNCRYVSPCEAVWRIFAFDIHYRDPAVQILSFHLPDEQSVVFNDGDTIDYVVENQGTKQSMFLAWMECNRHYPEAQSLTYLEFPTKFVWKRDERVSQMRKKGFAIGWLDYVPPGIGELYYLSLMLHRTPGAISYEHIRTVNNVIYPSFKDACYTLGLLDDDKEYIDGIIEASFWGSPHFLRKLFASLLLSGSVSRPEHVWENTWKVLADDILPRQRSLLGIDETCISVMFS